MRVWGGVGGGSQPSLGPHGKLPKMEYGPCGGWDAAIGTNRGGDGALG
jgi:hypothetical protein